ncbi:MAG: tryptophan--tRNA ligase [Patescibacteria group bacterium]
MQRALTALQPTNFLHIGNLFGAVLPMVEAQKDFQTFLFVVDYHAITLPQEGSKLNDAILFAVAAYIAAGADPEKTLIFQQSQVSQHTELAWILSCSAHMGELERMTQYKDKSKRQTESVSVGLLTYPILMAADILLYDTNIVPVGEDQKQHVELTRDLAERFNKRFGKTFVIPEPRIPEFGARIMGLDDPTKKMSKSAESPKNYISILDEPDVIRKKVMSAVTDSGLTVRYDKSRPALANLLTIMSLLTKQSFKEIEADYAGKGYGDFKKGLAEVLINYLEPLQTKIHELLEHPDKLREIVAKGSEKAKALAEKKMIEVRKKIGVTL